MTKNNSGPVASHNISTTQALRKYVSNFLPTTNLCSTYRRVPTKFTLTYGGLNDWYDVVMRELDSKSPRYSYQADVVGMHTTKN